MQWNINIIQTFFLNEKILPYATIWINLEGIMLSEISQTEKDKYCIESLTCGIWRKKIKTKKLIS